MRITLLRPMRLVAASFLFVIAAALLLPAVAYAAQDVRVHILPYDNMDVIVVECDGHFGLVDAGEDSDYPSGKDPRYPLRPNTTVGSGVEGPLIDYMKSIGVTRDNFDFLIGTHPHSDHIGAADEVIYELHPKVIYTPYYDDELISDASKLWDNQYVYDQLVEAALWASGNSGYGAKFYQYLGDENDPEDVDPDRIGAPVFRLGSATVEIVNYSTLYQKIKVPDANYFSYGVKVTGANGRQAFLSGDINDYVDGENASGDESTLAGQINNIDFLKLGHHGRQGSNSPYFLTTVLRPAQGDVRSVCYQTGEYWLLPLTTISTMNQLGCRFYNTYAVEQSQRNAFIATLSSGGVVTNCDLGQSVLQKRVSAPWAFLYTDGIPDLGQRGWLAADNGWRYFKDDGSIAMGWEQIDGNWYHFSWGDGIMQTGWLAEGDSLYYLDHTGVLHVGNGWERINGYWYYYQPNTADGAVSTGWINDGGAQYYLDPSWGNMVTGWAYVEGKWYYLASSGVMQIGWQRIGGVWYYLDGSGAMAEGWRNLGSAWYYLHPGSGAMATGWAHDGSAWYHLSSSGAMQTGWQRIGGAWYYLQPSGAMAEGWASVGGSWYYLYPGSGAMATGWAHDGSAWYLLSSSGAMKTGWQRVGNAWYYLQPSGAMAEGWANVGGSWYYLYPGSGAMATGWAKDGDTWYYLNKSGVMQTGWLRDGRTWYYLDGSGAMVTGEQTIDGAPYTFDASGAMM